jgi:hypothetical protein
MHIFSSDHASACKLFHSVKLVVELEASLSIFSIEDIYGCVVRSSAC